MMNTNNIRDNQLNRRKFLSMGITGMSLFLAGGSIQAQTLIEQGKTKLAAFNSLNSIGELLPADKNGIMLPPDFIVSVADLIHGDTKDKEQLLKEWDSFDKRAEKAGAPIFRVGGNHDLSNVTMWKVWSERYGPRYYYFIYHDVLFLILDTENYNKELMQRMYHATSEDFKKIPERSVGQIGSDQSSYFEHVLAANPNVKWTLLFMHKPTWKRTDNKGLAHIENALEGRPYTVFNGHVHSLSHRVRKGMDYMMLGTTGGSQNVTKANAFDHLTLVTMDKKGPSISHIRMDGLLDKTGNIPENGNNLCYQKSRCGLKQ